MDAGITGKQTRKPYRTKRRIQEEAAKIRAAEERYEKSVSECNYSYCMHYDEKNRRCPLLECVYDEEDEDFEWDG